MVDVYTRFWANVNIPETRNGCWLWEGTKNSGGYGQFSVRRPILAHRLSYVWEYGEIQEGLHIDHLCGNPPCVNPKHLEAVTPQENNRRRGAELPSRYDPKVLSVPTRRYRSDAYEGQLTEEQMMSIERTTKAKGKHAVESKMPIKLCQNIDGVNNG